MYPVQIRQLTDIVAGQLCGTVSSDALISGATIDSRTVQPGDVFFAVQGSSSHGADFAAEAVRRGAGIVITDRAPPSECGFPSGRSALISEFLPPDTVPHIRVADAVAALRALAEWHRSQSDALRICVTGSVGKTTTRRMIHAVLSADFIGIQSPANFNNHLGLPLSLMQLTPGDSFAALEIGASGPGEIASLAQLARPEFSVVTRVAPAHLNGFGSLEGVRRAKQELPENTLPHGTVFLNSDDPLVRQMAAAASANVVLFGEAKDSDVLATDVRSNNDRLSFRIAVSGQPLRQLFDVAAVGRHSLTCALAAVAVGLEAGMEPQQIQLGLSAFRADPGRGQVVRLARWTVIDDSYNASPASLTAAVATLSGWTGARHRILVLGDMLELGADAAAMHEAAGREIALSATDQILFFGDYAEVAADGFLKAAGRSAANRVSIFRDINVLQSMLDCIAGSGDVILVKGSRGMATERVVAWLTKNGGDSAGEHNAPARNAA